MSAANLKNIVVSPPVAGQIPPEPTPLGVSGPTVHPRALASAANNKADLNAEHSDGSELPTRAESSRWMANLSGFTFSLALHLLLLLVLSLIAIGSGQNLLPATLMVSQSSPDSFEIVTTEAFELESPSAVIEPTPEMQPDFKMELELQAPEFEVAGAVEPATSAESPPTESLATASASMAAPLSNIALSIQKRVSQAGGRQGEVQFALAWKNINDVDLHVIAPSGERISHMHKSSQCRGMLDVDMNVRGESDTPVENVRWLTGAPAGRYTILVNLFRIHRAKGGGRVYRGSEIQLLAQLGQDSHLETETVNQRNQVAVFRFMYVPHSVPETQRQRVLNSLTELQDQEEGTASRLLERAREVKKQQLRDQLLGNLITRYPHTDSAIEAMRLLGGRITKTGL